MSPPGGPTFFASYLSGDMMTTGVVMRVIERGPDLRVLPVFHRWSG